LPPCNETTGCAKKVEKMSDDNWTGKTIGMALDDAARQYGDRVATVFHNGAVTYNQLKQTSDLIARGFLKLGIGKGDKVAIWMACYSEWAFVYFALMRIGAVIVPVNTRYRPEEIEYVLNKSQSSLLVFKEEPSKDFLGLLGELCPRAGEAADALPCENYPILKDS
jgi:fatty-acyl-CoA synthase